MRTNDILWGLLSAASNTQAYNTQCKQAPRAEFGRKLNGYSFQLIHFYPQCLNLPWFGPSVKVFTEIPLLGNFNLI
jgi:hypothetical protein